MKLIIAIILAIAQYSLFAHEISPAPAGLTALKPGRYSMSASPDNAMFGKKVEAEFIVPAGIQGPAPVVVFFHGNSRDKKFYKKAADFLAKEAAQKKIILASVQNWWPLSGDRVEAFDDSRRATNLMLGKLIAAGAVNGDKVYLSGFSAGGFTAIATFIQSIHYNEMMGDKEANFFNYAGVISMKGNFYPQFFMPDPTLDPDARRKRFGELTREKKIILTVGGKKDAPRVQKQAPECRDFLRDWGIDVKYHEFAKEGHTPDKTNLNLLWSMLE